MANKPAVSSVTVWGGLAAFFGGFATMIPPVAQFIPFIPTAWQPIASGALAMIGGLAALYGRSNPNIVPIQGIIRSP